MRYQNLRSFQKHLATAAPDHLCSSYLVICADDYERRKIAKGILPPTVVFSGGESGVSEVLEALMPNLFGERSVVFFDEVEKLGKEELQRLGKGLPTAGYLLLGARKKVSVASAVERAGVILDLSEEKPWDREKRIVEQLEERVQRAGKRLASDVPVLLLERMGMDLAALDGEIDKLICFVGERPMIERVDVFRVCGMQRTQTLWQMAEEIVWGEGRVEIEGGDFHALVPALRSQLQLGLKVASLAGSQDNWSTYLPKVWPKTLEKRRVQVERLGAEYFQRGLRLLFEMELLSRTGSSQLGALFDSFCLGIHAR